MSLTTTHRDIMPPVPPGMVRTADFGTFSRDLYAEVTVLDAATGALHRYPTVQLVYSTRGYEIAGSCARWTEAYWAVRWSDGSASHGQRYSMDDEAKARAHFAKLTDPQAVSARRQEDAMLEDTVYAPARARAAAEAEAQRQAKRERDALKRRLRAGARMGKV